MVWVGYYVDSLWLIDLLGLLGFFWNSLVGLVGLIRTVFCLFLLCRLDWVLGCLFVLMPLRFEFDYYFGDFCFGWF